MEAQLINQHLGARCTVLSQENDFLFLGKLAQYNKANQTLVIENLGGQRALWSDISPNMPVKLQINSRAEKDGLLLFEGIVDNSTQDSIAIRLSLAISKKEGRNFFRQKVMRKGKIRRVNSLPVDHPCVILDISVKGIAIQSDRPYGVGDVLSMEKQAFREDGPLHTLTFQVARTSPFPTGGNLFGCRFIDLFSDDEDALFRDIFALQASDLRFRRSI